MTKAVVEWNRSGQGEQFSHLAVLGFDGVRVAPNVMAIMLLLGRGILGHFVRASLASWRPKDYERLALELLDAEDGEIRRVDQVAVLKQLLLNLVELPLRNAGGNTGWPSLQSCPMTR